MKTIKKLLTLIICLAMVLPLTACTGNKVAGKKIGILQLVTHPALDACTEGVVSKLGELGITKENSTIDIQNANGDTSLANTIAQKFVTDKVDVIVAIATPAAQAAYTAIQGTDIKVVFIAVSDPVAAGLVKDLNTPVENVTGVTDVLDVAAEVDLVKVLMPEASTVGVIYNTGEANSVVQVKDLEEATTKNNLKLEKVAITNTSEIAAGLDTLMSKCDVVINVLDNTVVSAIDLEIAKSLEHKTPVIGSEDGQVGKGALASNGFDYKAIGEQTAPMVVDVLSGKTVKIENAKKTQATVNKTTAKKLNIDITKLKDATIVE